MRLIREREDETTDRLSFSSNSLVYNRDREKLRLIDSGFCVLLEDYTLLNAWFQQQNRVLGTRGWHPVT